MRSIPDEDRFKVFDYLVSRGFGSRDLGIESTYYNKLKNLRVRVSDSLLERILTVDEFIMLMGGSQLNTAGYLEGA